MIALFLAIFFMQISKADTINYKYIQIFKISFDKSKEKEKISCMRTPYTAEDKNDTSDEMFGKGDDFKVEVVNRKGEVLSSKTFNLIKYSDIKRPFGIKYLNETGKPQPERYLAYLDLTKFTDLHKINVFKKSKFLQSIECKNYK